MAAGGEAQEELGGPWHRLAPGPASAHPGFRHVRLADGQGRHRGPGHPHQEGRHHQRGRHARRCLLVHHDGRGAWYTMVLVVVEVVNKKLRTSVYFCDYKCALQYTLLFIEQGEKYKTFKNEWHIQPKYQVSNTQFILS